MENLERIFNQLILNAEVMYENLNTDRGVELSNENKNLWSEAQRLGIAEELGEKISKHFSDEIRKLIVEVS